MHPRQFLAASVIAIGVATLASAAHAQSTGSVDFERETEIVVTGSILRDIAGIELPATSKSKQVLTSEQIQRSVPGQSVLDTINVVPGVNYTQADGYGLASGGQGQLTIRGFSQDRISLTFDGIPVNDSGNYQVYSHQQLDSELIEEVNVNLGTTDVDSPTAAATGSTVNYRTRDPSEDFGVKMSGSAGEDEFFRMFGMIDTGVFTPWGTRAFLAASHTEANNPFNNYGRNRKDQYNAKIYQPIGNNGDFISIAGHWNESRNNFFGSLPLRRDTTQSPVNPAPRVVGSLASNRFPITEDERDYLINYPCVNPAAVAGVADTQTSCGTEFDRRYNPSDTGNIRLNSRFSLTDDLVLTVDPSFQYVKANGGGTANAQEGALRDINPAGGTASTAACRTTPSSATNTCVAGYLGGTPYFGRDINGDGDILDTVAVLAPSQTQTKRIGVIAGLRWDFSEGHSMRVSYTFDRARHRQTGQIGLLNANGEPVSVFPVDDPQTDATGTVLQKRDRLSYAILHQISGEYRGEFFDRNLVVTLGVRAPFFKRDLNNYCFTSSETGFVECFGKGDPRNATFAALNPTIQGPQQRVLKYDKILPNIGAVYKVTPDFSVYANYSKGLQVPGTDSLYNAFFFPANTPSAKPAPETTDNYELGLRLRSGKILAQASGWYTKYKNRLASAYDPDTEKNLYRNLGAVDKYGIDGSIAWQPVPQLSLYAFGSWMKSKILDDVQSGTCNAAQVGTVAGCTAVGSPLFVATAGKRESGAPAYSYGASVRGTTGPFELGVTAKRTGGRYIYDTNLPIYTGTAAAPVEIFPAKTPAYWLVNLDARLNLSVIGLNDKSYFQLNVYNLFDQLYVGNYTSGLNQGGVIGRNVFIATPGSPPFAQIGAPRAISGTIVFGF